MLISECYHFPAGNYIFKINNRNTRTRCEMFKVNNKDTRTTPLADGWVITNNGNKIFKNGSSKICMRKIAFKKNEVTCSV